MHQAIIPNSPAYKAWLIGHLLTLPIPYPVLLPVCSSTQGLNHPIVHSVWIIDHARLALFSNHPSPLPFTHCLLPYAVHLPIQQQMELSCVCSRQKLTAQCSAELFDEEVGMAESIDFQIRMKNACTQEIGTFCRNVPHGHARVIRSTHPLLITPHCSPLQCFFFFFFPFLFFCLLLHCQCM